MNDELLERLLGPGDREIGCDACFDELDRYVEARAGRRAAGPGRPRDGGAPARLPGLQEEYESLRDLLAAEPVETGRMPG